MIIESGVIVALGLVGFFAKMSWRARLRMLSHPLALDLVVFVLLTSIHWGTFSGVMVAATGSLVCSALITIGRKAFGYIEKDRYVPGMWNITDRLLADRSI